MLIYCLCSCAVVVFGGDAITQLSGERGGSTAHLPILMARRLGQMTSCLEYLLGEVRGEVTAVSRAAMQLKVLTNALEARLIVRVKFFSERIHIPILLKIVLFHYWVLRIQSLQVLKT
jgi:hypothetical protein